VILFDCRTVPSQSFGGSQAAIPLIFLAPLISYEESPVSLSWNFPSPSISRELLILTDFAFHLSPFAFLLAPAQAFVCEDFYRSSGSRSRLFVYHQSMNLFLKEPYKSHPFYRCISRFLWTSSDSLKCFLLNWTEPFHTRNVGCTVQKGIFFLTSATCSVTPFVFNGRAS